MFIGRTVFVQQGSARVWGGKVSSIELTVAQEAVEYEGQRELDQLRAQTVMCCYHLHSPAVKVKDVYFVSGVDHGRQQG